ncbi:Ig domain-containing protein [Leucobacter sp. M11]|uniref:Ig domain-containing protein n=1 Tax=Leucobacter sp. M11 TaxID=2993565 RepID=UPI002D7EA2E3|nr:Ig domain-containing protein [Leucobacter sp. M11]MEB4616280.1 Ig domain-containing protein [Leucobacter sp. M11]
MFAGVNSSRFRRSTAAALGAGVALTLLVPALGAHEPAAAAPRTGVLTADANPPEQVTETGIVYQEIEAPESLSEMTYTGDGTAAYAVSGRRIWGPFDSIGRLDTATNEVTGGIVLPDGWVPAEGYFLPTKGERLGLLVERNNEQEFGIALVGSDPDALTITAFADPELPGLLRNGLFQEALSDDGTRLFLAGREPIGLRVIDTSSGEELAHTTLSDAETPGFEFASGPHLKRNSSEVLVSLDSYGSGETRLLRYDSTSLERLGGVNTPASFESTLFTEDETALWGIGPGVHAVLIDVVSGHIQKTIALREQTRLLHPFAFDEQNDRLFYNSPGEDEAYRSGSASPTTGLYSGGTSFYGYAPAVSPTSFHPITGDLLFFSSENENHGDTSAQRLLIAPSAANPEDQKGGIGDTVTFAAQTRGVTRAGGVDANFRWQLSTDGGETWADLPDDAEHTADFDRLSVTVTPATLKNQYRGLVSSGYWGRGELTPEGTMRSGHTEAARIVPDAVLAIVTESLPAGTVGTDYGRFPIEATQTPGAAPLAWSAVGLPKGLSLDPATGVITGTPTESGTHQVTITVSDDTGTVSRTYLVAVAPKEKPPVITPEPPVTTTPPTVTDPPVTTGPSPSDPAGPGTVPTSAAGGSGTGSGLAATGAGAGLLWAGGAALLLGAGVLLLRRLRPRRERGAAGAAGGGEPR